MAYKGGSLTAESGIHLNMKRKAADLSRAAVFRFCFYKT
nr:MAG TPA: hypothetical protein [Caudoviricetes sp.]